MFGKDTKKTQLKKGGSHNCRIDETVQLEVTGDPQTGQILLEPFASLSYYTLDSPPKQSTMA